MKLKVNFFRFCMVALMAIVCTMCTTDEGVSPSDDTAISGRGLISGGTGTTVNLIGLSTVNELVFMTVSHSAVETGVIPITGLRPGESIIAIDKTKDLYGLSNQSTVYKISPLNGVARPLGPAFAPALNGAVFGFDVSPTDNVIRVMTSGQNLRISSTNGQVVGQDAAWHVATLAVNSIAYLPAVSGGKATLYAIDIAAQRVYKQAPAGTGPVSLVGSTGFEWSAEGGFDIAPNGVGYAVQFGHGTNGEGPGVGSSGDLKEDNFRLHSVNLKTGVATSLGIVRPMMGITVK